MTILSEKATTVAVEGSTWRGVVKDSTATAGAVNLFNTTPRWLLVSKRLVDPKALKGPKKILDQARNFLRGDSPGPDGKFIPGGLPPWDRKGRFILPNAMNEEVVRALGEFKSRFEDAVEALRSDLPAAIDQARYENPDLFKDTDYGGVEGIIERYRFDIEFDLIPDAGDIRVDASKQFVAALKSSVETRSAKKLNEVTAHAISTIVEVVGHFADALSAYDPDKKGAAPFRDSTVDKVRDLIGVIPALNVQGDAKIDQIRQDLIAAIGNKSAKELREDADVRKDTVEKARAVANNIDNLFG